MPKANTSTSSPAVITERQNPDNKLKHKRLVQLETKGRNLVLAHCADSLDLSATHTICDELAVSHTVSDAIANLLHYAHAMGFSTVAAVKEAVQTYKLERGLGVE